MTDSSDDINRLEHREYHYHADTKLILETTKEGFAKVSESLEGSANRIASIEKEQAVSSEALRRVLLVLDGNGRPSLGERLTNIEKDNEAQEETLEELNTRIARLKGKLEKYQQGIADKMWEILKPLIAAALAAGTVAAMNS